MTIEVVQLGAPEEPPYPKATPEERLAAAVRLIGFHTALRGASPRPPRAAWPGETFVIGEERG